jgi:hypothetical protein
LEKDKLSDTVMELISPGKKWGNKFHISGTYI